MDIIEFIRYVVYGLTQGFFEVLPISSSGLVNFIQNIANREFIDTNNNFFLAVVNLGSLVAVVIYMRKRIKTLLVESYKYAVKKEENVDYKKSYRFLINILIAAIPTGVVGVIYAFQGINFNGYDLVIVGVGALLTGTILFYSRNTVDRYTNTIVNRNQAWYVGIFQILSIIPGVSRLAVTTAAGTHKEMSYETSLIFSLLIYIPISLGSIFVLFITGAINYSAVGNPWYTAIYYIVSLIVSFFATMAALKYLFIITRKGNFRFFYVINLFFGFVSLMIGIAQLN
jgi:undecaprenyl-diphosphatase